MIDLLKPFLTYCTLFSNVHIIQKFDICYLCKRVCCRKSVVEFTPLFQKSHSGHCLEKKHFFSF
uniref:Uncharacterized protein n=1 Tax=Arabidopsis thaliana TaxID=3702 RepID=Q0WU24_ARATH|nr:hypothetical protein [Arabidopsis thaliana]